MKLLGKTFINGKQFTMEDSIGTVYRQALGLPDDFYGGYVKEYRKTEYGIYLCLNKKKEIVNLGYFDNGLTEKGKELLFGKKSEPEKEVPAIDEVPPINETPPVTTEKELLIEQAKTLNIKGVLQNMKEETLIKKIKEATK